MEKKTKRAPRGTGHIRQRTDGIWEGQYYFEGRRKSVYADSEDECRGELNVILGKIYQGTYIDGKMMPLYVYLDFWHKRYPQIRPSTHSNYDSYINGHLFNSRIGSIPLCKLTYDDFDQFFKEKKQGGRLDGKSGGLSPKTLRNIKNMLNEALDLAVYPLKYMEFNPMKNLKLPKVVQKEVVILAGDDQRRIEQAVLRFSNPNALMVLIDLYTGLRLGEICAISWPDVSGNFSYFDIRHTLKRLYIEWAAQDDSYQLLPYSYLSGDKKTALYLGEPKTESGKRRIFSPEPVVQGFQKILAYQQENGIYSPDGFVFLRPNGYPYEPDLYRNQLYKKVLKAAKVDYVKFHALRHTFATEALRMDFDLATLAEILGHAQKTTVLNMYTHSTDDHKKQQMAKFNTRVG